MVVARCFFIEINAIKTPNLKHCLTFEEINRYKRKIESDRKRKKLSKSAKESVLCSP